MNRKGFTLIELIATIVVLSLVVGISSYAITAIIKKTKENNYASLIENIENAGETYYQECKYVNNGVLECNKTDDNAYVVSLGNLVSYGYLKGNDTDNNDKYIVVNPLDNADISACMITISYYNGNIVINSVSDDSSCPSEYNQQYAGLESGSFPSAGASSSGGGESWGSSGDELTPVLPSEPVTPGDPVTPITPVNPKDEVS